MPPPNEMLCSSSERTELNAKRTAEVLAMWSTRADICPLLTSSYSNYMKVLPAPKAEETLTPDRWPNTGEPPFTTYTDDWYGTLDYIMLEASRVQPAAIAELPGVKVVTKETAIPNSTFPSDHLSIVADLRVISA